MLLKIALNGARPKSENEYMPQSLTEIEREVYSLYLNGYKVFHIHCYDKTGKESLKPEDMNNLVSRIKNMSPEIQIGISTGDWIEPDLEKRIDYIKGWKILPDFASVNMIESNSVDISKALIERGVLVEAGLNDKEAAEIFVKSKLTEGVCRILIEPEEENFSAAINTINEIETVLDSTGINIKRLLHGFNSASWDILREAKKRGYEGRMGMEDTIYLESGIKVNSNVEFINYAEEIINGS